MKHLRKHLIPIGLVVLVTLLNILPSLAQEAEAGGRAVTREDWISFMPVFVGSIIIVLIVDAFFIIPIFRKKDDDKDAQS